MEKTKLKSQLEELIRTLNSFKHSDNTYLIGRILTITDAVTADPDQRKAIKDLVQDAFWGNNFPGQRSAMQAEVEALAKAYGIDDLFTQETLPALDASWAPSNKYLDIK